MSEITELDSIVNNLNWLSRQFPSILSNWKADNKTRYPKGCSEVALNFPEGTKRKRIIEDLCEHPSQYMKYFEPVLTWLSIYRSNRVSNAQGRLRAFTRAELDNMIRKGVRAFHNLATIIIYFGDRPELYKPNFPLVPENQGRNKEILAEQKNFSEFSYTLASKIIGCPKKGVRPIFPFLDLSKTVKLEKDLQEMQDYLSKQCLAIRTNMLRF